MKKLWILTKKNAANVKIKQNAKIHGFREFRDFRLIVVMCYVG